MSGVCAASKPFSSNTLRAARTSASCVAADRFCLKLFLARTRREPTPVSISETRVTFDLDVALADARSERGFTFLAEGPMTEETRAAEGLTVEHLDCTLDVTYNWGYEMTRKDLRDLYNKAKRSQWISEDTLPWSVSVDPQKASFPEELFP